MLIKLYHEFSRSFNLTEHDNRATSGAAADATFADAILPMAINLREAFTVEVIDFYEAGYKFDYIDTEPRTQSDEANTSNVLYSGNIITRNEARLRVGEKPVGDTGDTFADGSKLSEQKVSQDFPSSKKIVKEQQSKQALQLSLFDNFGGEL
jgi:hypothetical protein